ncbi:MAG: signal recognition particle-docking protein FtsY [Clostridia bacterium]|nr:signal recognition particle-docking protein FtsY [Clostridia bacterium]
MDKKPGFFQKLKQGLSKTGGGLLANIFGGEDRITEEFYEELEEAMIVADMGMITVEKIVDELRERISDERIKTRTEAKEVLVKILADTMRPETEFVGKNEKAVLLIVGVNGVGKTTSIGKLALYYKSRGNEIVMAAADTFRAAAAEQLTVWSERAEVPIIKHAEGADPAAVVFDAAASFKAKNKDILLCDTAGRLHNKKNLMNELEKICRVLSRELPDVRTEVLLVIDATTGQNALMQAKAFKEAANLTGIILTKLDGTAKGGVAVAVKEELQIPVRFVGVGEGIDDLLEFDPDAFASALLGKDKE